MFGKRIRIYISLESDMALEQREDFVSDEGRGTRTDHLRPILAQCLLGVWS